MRLMITTMRDEAPFILEWVAYHRLIGFTDFLIYSNDCSDGTDAMLDRLAELGVVTHVPNPRKGRKTVQWQALSRARNHRLARRADWIMVADVDEFLVIHAGDGRLADLFAALPDARGFAVPWRMFGSSGRLRFEPGLVMEQFLRAAPDRLAWPLRAGQFKSLFRRDPRLVRLGVHRPQSDKDQPFPDGWVDGSGRSYGMSSKSFMFTTEPRYDVAQLNHYSLGSCENFLVKMARGRPNHMDLPIDLSYWVDGNFNSVEERSILRHAPAVQGAVNDLLADPELARLHDQGIGWRRDRIAQLLRQEDFFHVFSRIVQLPEIPALPMQQQLGLVRMWQKVLLQKDAETKLRERDTDRQRTSRN